MGKNDNEQFGVTLNDIRRELDGKIESKVSSHTFYWGIGGLAAFGAFLFYILFAQIGKVSDTISGITSRVVTLETKVDDHKNDVKR